MLRVFILYLKMLLVSAGYETLETAYPVAELVQALCYKPKGPGFDYPWDNWNFLLTLFFWPHCGAGVGLVSNRDEYHEYLLRSGGGGGKGGQYVGLTTLPP
jgi:hypothetical protein